MLNAASRCCWCALGEGPGVAVDRSNTEHTNLRSLTAALAVSLVLCVDGRRAAEETGNIVVGTAAPFPRPGHDLTLKNDWEEEER